MPAAPTVGTPQKTDPAMEKVLTEHLGNDEAAKKEMRATMSKLDAYGDALDQLAAFNRKTMVLPAPADFKPENAKRKIRLKLTLEKTVIKPGDPLRFRLEVTNVGREPIDYDEPSPSIFKYGGPNDSEFIKLFATAPDGKRDWLISLTSSRRVAQYMAKAPPPPSIPNESSGLTGDAADGPTSADASLATNEFKVRLLPGETLRSRGDWNATGDVFRTLLTDQEFDQPGTYKIEAVLDDMPGPLTQADIDEAKSYSTPEETRRSHDEDVANALGPLHSNALYFTVSP